MGMYTEFFFAAEVDRVAADQLDEFVNDNDNGAPKSDHPFFSTPRASILVGGGWSAYSSGHPIDMWTEEEYSSAERPTAQVTIRSSVKNYDDVIGQFLRYITPHVISGTGDREFVGYSLYEEDPGPTTYFIEDGALYEDYTREADLIQTYKAK